MSQFLGRELSQNLFCVTFSGIDSGKKWRFWVPILGLPLFIQTQMCSCPVAIPVQFWDQTNQTSHVLGSFQEQQSPTKMINLPNFGCNCIAACIASLHVALLDSFQFWQSVVSMAGNDSMDAHNTQQTT